MARKIKVLKKSKAQIALDEQMERGVNTKIVTNLLSGKLVKIPVDTPLCCDPSSETYWSM